MISLLLTELVTYAETATRVHPFDGTFIAGDSAASTFQTSLIREGNVLVSKRIAIGGTDINANRHITFLALRFIHSYMNVPVDLEFIQG
jgi:hypothetical protein